MPKSRRTITRQIWFPYYHMCVTVSKEEFETLIERREVKIDEEQSTEEYFIADAVDAVEEQETEPDDRKFCELCQKFVSTVSDHVAGCPDADDSFRQTACMCGRRSEEDCMSACVAEPQRSAS